MQDAHKELLDRIKTSGLLLSCILLHDWAFTARLNGKVVMCGGSTGDEIWAWLGKDMRKAMVPVTRYGMERIRRQVEQTGRPALAWIDNNIPNAVRWVRLTGFRPINDGYWTYP